MSVRGADWEPTLEDPEVRAYIIEEAGEEALTVARYLREHPHVSGVDLVEAFPDRKPSAVRKALYRLMESHAAEYEKDTDAKGWETFWWDLDLQEVKNVLRRRWADELQHVRKQIRFERDHLFYACADAHRRIVFEDAIDMQFKCPVCQAMMQPAPASDVREQLEARAAELEPHVGQS